MHKRRTGDLNSGRGRGQQWRAICLKCVWLQATPSFICALSKTHFFLRKKTHFDTKNSFLLFLQNMFEHNIWKTKEKKKLPLDLKCTYLYLVFSIKYSVYNSFVYYELGVFHTLVSRSHTGGAQSGNRRKDEAFGPLDAFGFDFFYSNNIEWCKSWPLLVSIDHNSAYVSF